MENVTASHEAGNAHVCPPIETPPRSNDCPSGTAEPERGDPVEILHAIGRRAYRHAAGLSPEQRIDLLRLSVVPWDGTTTATAYPEGRNDTRDGIFAGGPWEEFGEMLISYAQEVVPDKGAGMWITPARSVNGRCRDRDIDCISQLSFDCDGAGDWHAFRRLLDGAGLAYILQRSSSHRAEHPKWHAHIPLVPAWGGTKKEWRRRYRHSVGWFSGAAELKADLDSTPPAYGFDTKTDRLGQPWFLPARRSENHPVPETIIVHGGALELEFPSTDGI